MAEHLRTVKIAIEIDTNKWTYREEFTSMREAVEWWNQHEELHGDKVEVTSLAAADKPV